MASAVREGEPSEGSAVVTNPVYSKLFVELGLGSVVVGIVLAVLVPFLRKLIRDEEQPAEMAAPASDAATA